MNYSVLYLARLGSGRRELLPGESASGVAAEPIQAGGADLLGGERGGRDARGVPLAVQVGRAAAAGGGEAAAGARRAQARVLPVAHADRPGGEGGRGALELERMLLSFPFIRVRRHSFNYRWYIDSSWCLFVCVAQGEGGRRRRCHQPLPEGRPPRPSRAHYYAQRGTLLLPCLNRLESFLR